MSFCRWQRKKHDGGLGHESLLEGVDLLVTEGFKTPAAAQNFENLGDEFGVSNVP
ncbi:hypothetical protein WMF27_35460 [Sorangium sp. So ce281]|uniref:hypothetical protein n=1 Tax=unclassified Sorangium TaxID=2621164 RepID=UPI003F6431C0